MDPASPRLDGWKAIAAYLGRDERTAQRWRLRGLPVHQVPGGKRGTVFAYTQEIDDWLTRQTEAQTSVKPESAGLLPPVDTSAVVSVHESAGQVEPWLWSAVRKQVHVALVVGLIALVLVAAIVATKRWGQAGSSPVVRAEVSATGLTAWTATGVAAFSIPVRDLVPRDIASSTVPALVGEHGRETVVDDFDGDGSPDVVAILAFREDRLVTSHLVVSYSSSGTLQWQYHVQRQVRFGDRDFTGPWRVSDRLVTRDPDGRLRLFLAFVDDVWWPSFIVSLDANGRERLHFVNAGHLSRLQHLRASDGDVLLAVGVNNEYGSAVLTAIDLDAPAAISPQHRFLYTCRDCTEGRPTRYMLFPPAELVALQSRPYNLGDALTVTSSEVLVSMQELADSSARSHYRLSRTLDVKSFGMSDVYWEVHKQFEKRGEIHHSAANCPERTGRRLQVWTDEGWQPLWVRTEPSQ
jgi:hypothetical protein